MTNEDLEYKEPIENVIGLSPLDPLNGFAGRFHLGEGYYWSVLLPVSLPLRKSVLFKKYLLDS